MAQVEVVIFGRQPTGTLLQKVRDEQNMITKYILVSERRNRAPILIGEIADALMVRAQAITLDWREVVMVFPWLLSDQTDDRPTNHRQGRHRTEW